MLVLRKSAVCGQFACIVRIHTTESESWVKHFGYPPLCLADTRPFAVRGGLGRSPRTSPILSARRRGAHMDMHNVFMIWYNRVTHPNEMLCYMIVCCKWLPRVYIYAHLCGSPILLRESGIVGVFARKTSSREEDPRWGGRQDSSLASATSTPFQPETEPSCSEPPTEDAPPDERGESASVHCVALRYRAVRVCSASDVNAGSWHITPSSHHIITAHHINSSRITWRYAALDYSTMQFTTLYRIT